jgi:hypothetical protein
VGWEHLLLSQLQQQLAAAAAAGGVSVAAGITIAIVCSAYSNSFVNLAIFKPDVERSRVADIIGNEAEELTHLFCVVSGAPDPVMYLYLSTVHSSCA